jgi:hypothetical protein
MPAPLRTSGRLEKEAFRSIERLLGCVFVDVVDRGFIIILLI